MIETLLKGLSFAPAAVYRMTDKFSFGLGAHMMYGMFKQTSKINNVLDVNVPKCLMLSGYHDGNRGPLAGHVVGKFRNVNGQFINFNL